jgi:thioredoxin reductase (NADPH)
MSRDAWDYDCAVIGGGPGGLVAALYLRRFRRRAVLFNHGRPRAWWGPRIHNLVGYHRGISGKLLLRRLERQLDQVGGLARNESEARVHPVRGGFEVRGASGVVTRARKVVLATGIEDAQPELENLAELRALGLLKYCSICDGYEIREQPIAVLARDDFGIQKALFLACWTRDIRVLVPPSLRLAPQRVREIREARARVMRCTRLRLRPAKGLGGGVWVRADRHRPFLASVAYVELGCRVRDEAFAHLRKLRRTRDGFLVTTTEQRTSVPGLFAVGDCVNLLGQVSVAAGQAAVAATTLHNDLLEGK